MARVYFLAFSLAGPEPPLTARSTSSLTLVAQPGRRGSRRPDLSVRLGGVGRGDLPRDVNQVTLSYDRLVSALEMIDGEIVVVNPTTRTAEAASPPGTASIVGELRRQVPARYEGSEFSIGYPYPDRQPAHPAGGVLFVDQKTLESATLTTFDGNDYFVIAIKTASIELIVEGIDSAYP